MSRVWNKFKNKLRPEASNSTQSDESTSTQIIPHVVTVTEPEAEASSEDQQNVRNAIWNAAYEELYEEEEDLMKAYENTILKLRELHGESALQGETPANGKPDRWRHIQEGIRIGLERTEREAKIKRQMGEVVRLTDSVRGLISKATKHSPEATLAWSGFCLTAEVRSSIILSLNEQRLIVVRLSPIPSVSPPLSGMDSSTSLPRWSGTGI